MEGEEEVEEEAEESEDDEVKLSEEQNKYVQRKVEFCNKNIPVLKVRD